MDLMIVQYIVFIIASLILILAVIEINKRLYRQNKSRSGSPGRWIELDAKRRRGELALEDFHLDEDREELETELHTQARQNGHRAESQRPQL